MLAATGTTEREAVDNDGGEGSEVTRAIVNNERNVAAWTVTTMASQPRKYQFAPEGHQFLNRAAARHYAEIVALSRNHGLEVEKKTSGDYPKYDCLVCDGLMHLKFESVTSGTVAKCKECTCEERPPIDIKGKVYQTMRELKSNFIASVADHRKVVEITGQSEYGRRNNGFTAYVKVELDDGEGLEVSVKIEGKDPKTFRVVDLTGLGIICGPHGQ